MTFNIVKMIYSISYIKITKMYFTTFSGLSFSVLFAILVNTIILPS